MLKIIKFEIGKQVKRKENLILFFMFLMPLLYSIGVYRNSNIITYNSSELVNGLSFAKDMFTFIYMAFIVYIILAINSSNILRGEIENDSINIMLTRINNRSKIYRAKLYTQIIYWTVITCLFILFSIFCYYIFISKLKIASGSILSEGWISDTLIIISLWSSYIFAISMVQSLSMNFKPFVSIGIFIIVFIILMYLKEFPKVQLVSPFYYLNKILDNWNTIIFVKYMIINWGLVFLFSFLGIKKFKKSDL